jgi:hypothetical protein
MGEEGDGGRPSPEPTRPGTEAMADAAPTAETARGFRTLLPDWRSQHAHRRSSCTAPRAQPAFFQLRRARARPDAAKRRGGETGGQSGGARATTSTAPRKPGRAGAPCDRLGRPRYVEPAAPPNGSGTTGRSGRPAATARKLCSRDSAGLAAPERAPRRQGLQGGRDRRRDWLSSGDSPPCRRCLDTARRPLCLSKRRGQGLIHSLGQTWAVGRLLQLCRALYSPPAFLCCIPNSKLPRRRCSSPGHQTLAPIHRYTHIPIYIPIYPYTHAPIAPAV